MKKTLFRGFKPVFLFTAKQNLKTKGFLATTILVALIMFAIPFGVNVFMGVSSKEDNEIEAVGGEDTEGTDVENVMKAVYIVNNSTVDDALISSAIQGYGAETGKSLQVVMGQKQSEEDLLKNAEATLKNQDAIYAFSEDAGQIVLQVYVLEEQEDMETQAQVLADYLTNSLPSMSYMMAGLEMDTIVNIQAGSHYTVTQAGEKAEEVGVILVRTLLPMMVGLILYMLINMSTQSVTKVVIAEKTSKLMETLLTSAMPYGIVAGKVLAVTLMAIGQMLLWLVSLVGGFATGHLVAKSIHPEYENMVMTIIDMIRDSAADAFSVPTLIIGVLMLMLGFLFYCLYAGLVGTFVQKAEDLGNAQMFLVLPMMICWMAAYFAPMFENELLYAVVRFFPLTSVFSVPADVIVGNVSIFMGLGSMAILIAATLLLTLLTGYMYKKRVFK